MKYQIKRMPSEKRVRKARAQWRDLPYGSNEAIIHADSGEDALRQFAETLNTRYTAKEFRPASRYLPAFLVTRCWNGLRNYHTVRFEAWELDG